MADVKTGYELSVDQGVCMGAGLCTGSYPHLFRRENARAVPVERVIEPTEDAVDAADYCPFGAISVVDQKTGEELVADD